VKQCLDAEEPFSGADFKIDGHAVTQITIVGQVRSVTALATNITYKIDDGTGQIDVKKWVDAETPPEEEEIKLEDAHVRVYGRIKSLPNRRFINANNVRRITDHDEVNYHMLESTYVHLYFTKGKLSNGNAGQDGDSMFVGGGNDSYGNGAANGAKASNLSGGSKKVLSFLQNHTPTGVEGVHSNVIATATGMPVRDVLQAADDLLNQGLIYTTLDDETWAILEY
jgi:hypothetical protein